jgi:hypothetical protein
MINRYVVTIIFLGAIGLGGCVAKIEPEQAVQIDNNFAFVVKKHDQLAERVKKLEDQLGSQKKVN